MVYVQAVTGRTYAVEQEPHDLQDLFADASIGYLLAAHPVTSRHNTVWLRREHIVAVWWGD